MTPKSSARQLEIEGLFANPARVETGSEFNVNAAGASSSERTGSSVPGLAIPDFRGGRRAYALSSRMAGRLNAASVSDGEYQKLLAERQLLVDKQLDETITRKEVCRLELVRWSLDRIEDAKYGRNLDVLEDHVAAYEKLAADLSSLRAQLEQYGKGRRTT